MSGKLTKRIDPKVRARVRAQVRRTKAKCAKYEPALNRMLDQVFLHGPLEVERADPEALRHPEFCDLFDAVQIDGRSFYDLSGMGRYHMTGEHAAIDEKPWRPPRSALNQPPPPRDGQ